MAYSQLDRPVQFLKAVGPHRSDALKKLGIGTARDLLFHVPRRYDDASTIRPIASIEVGMDATAVGRVRSKGIIPTRSGLRIFQAVIEDASGYITSSWPGQPWLERRVREGDELLVTGPVKHFHGRQIHPREFTILSREGRDGEAVDEGRDGPGGRLQPGAIFVTYPAVDEVPQWVLRGIFQRNLDWLLDQIPDEEYLSDEARGELGLPGLREALRRLHRPDSVVDPEEGRRRLAFDELFFLQLVQALVRHQNAKVEPGIRFQRTNALIRPLHETLPFRLTDAQARVLREIYDDMTSGQRMNRFLQGDVGAGKTLVAFFAMLLAAESGHQSALMAPTELLAEQHFATLGGMIAAAGLDLEVVLLTGRMAAADRRDALARLAGGPPASIAVGTHALIQEGVRFARLGLVIVDEQHRFGVRQRMALVDGVAPGMKPDVLVMSATPIPRSLAMTLYGELELSVLDELPPGRTPVETLLRYPGRREQVYARVREELAKGHQGYIVYPQVQESEKTDLRAATEEYERLAKEVFTDRRVGLLHGQLAPEEKDRVMRGFRDGSIDLIVATSVVEVGIDVPNATFMVIEHAERFGLSQLHQLRGRVGRGSAPAVCVLIAEVGGDAGERLKVFRDTNDGFRIAEADLRIRGPGDLFGAQQHGRDPLLRFADLTRDEELVERARSLAREIVAADPELAAPAHARMRDLLATRHAERLKMWKVG
ncbi:MAG: ATP-dependent DNA helicase RecG [Gemmatimonadetes bacterium]|nr:ATP-dependent DNA helicase RecG [Gemmatimonadota bacterium]